MWDKPINRAEQCINKQRRHANATFVVSGIGGALALNKTGNGWIKPVVQSVILPLHAQSTIVSSIGEISCSGMSPTGLPLSPGDFVSGDVQLTVSTNPPEPNGLFTINGLCDGNVVSTSPNNPLDENGEFTFPFSAEICLPQGPGVQSFGARLTLQSSGATVECSYNIPVFDGGLG